MRTRLLKIASLTLLAAVAGCSGGGGGGGEEAGKRLIGGIRSGPTTEAGGQASFTVVLRSKPSREVVVPVSSANLAEGTVAPATLTFTKDNWNAPQSVLVTG